jgi:hypothetical protein
VVPDAQPIPRVIHWLWLGGAAVPDLFTHYTDSWRRHHPTWQTRLWRDDSVRALSGLNVYEQVTGFKKRYDILRLEILRQCGGVIVDMDVEAIRPIDPLLSGVSGFIGRVNANHVGNQVLGAVPHHPFFEAAVHRLQTTVVADESASDAVGKGFLKQLLTDRPDGMIVFPPETFHFQPSFDPPRRPDEFPGVYAVHHELASYTTPPDASDLDAAIASLMKAAQAAAHKPNEKRLARLEKRAEQLRRAVARQTRGYDALLRRAEAQREQAEARLRLAAPGMAAPGAPAPAGPPSRPVPE